MTRVVAVWGCGASVGKSIVTFALSRYLVRHGLRVRAIKPLSVSGGAIRIPADDRRVDVLAVNYATATRTELDPSSVPIALETDSPLVNSDVFNADYHVRAWLSGRFAGAGRLQQLAEWLPSAEAVVRCALMEAATDSEVVVVEGSGSPVDAAHVAVLANHRATRGLRRAAVLIADCLQGNPFAQIAGTLNLLGTEAPTVGGYILNRVHGCVPRPAGFEEQIFNRGVVDLGQIAAREPGPRPAVRDLGPGTTGRLDLIRTDAWFDEVAEVVTAGLDLEQLMDSMPELHHFG